MDQISDINITLHSGEKVISTFAVAITVTADIRFDLTGQSGGGFHVKRTLHIINDDKMPVETGEWDVG
jgi:hypothetical protein